MRLPGQIAVFAACALSASLGVADVASCQSVLERPPNLSGGWLGAPGTLQFNFVHRFGVSDAPLRKVTNSPTFLLSYQLPLPLLIGFNYATSSDIAAAFPNEWEVFAYTMQKVFPDRPIVEIPDEDPVFHAVYDLKERYQIPG